MKTIELKSNKNMTYFITGLTEKDFNSIMASKDREDLLRHTCDKILGAESNIELIGSTKEASYLTVAKYVAPLKGYEPSIVNPKKKVQFRDYGRTEEDQLKNAWLVATFEDANGAAINLLNKIKFPYLCIWFKRKI